MTAELRTVGHLLLDRSEDDRPGLIFEGHTLLWHELVTEAAVRARFLDAKLDRRRPAHVGVLLENVPDHIHLLGAAALCGATIVGLNPTRRGAELARDIAHTDCQLVITSTDLRPLLPDSLDVPVHLVDEPQWLYGLSPLRGEAAPAAPSGDHTLGLLFTSGSTSAPKAVPRSSATAASAGEKIATGFGLTADDVAYCQMPLFHGNALLACWVASLSVGATIVLRRRFSASGFVDDVRRHGCTFFTYVGRSIQYVLAQPPTPGEADLPLRMGFGTEASVEDRMAFEERFGCRLLESYGSSEAAIVIVRTPDTPPEALGVPRPGDDSDIVVVDVDGNECAVGEVGELVNRNGGGPFTGYYNNPEATAARLRDGWFWSGDLAWKDADGFFHFAGRSDERIRVDGENLSPELIARLLERLTGIAAAAVYPMADPTTGDLVMAAVEMEPGVDFDADRFHAELHAQPDLGTKWPPTWVRVVDELPLTANNKIRVGVLRAEGFETEDPIWHAPTRGGRYELQTG